MWILGGAAHVFLSQSLWRFLLISSVGKVPLSSGIRILNMFQNKPLVSLPASFACELIPPSSRPVPVIVILLRNHCFPSFNFTLNPYFCSLGGHSVTSDFVCGGETWAWERLCSRGVFRVCVEGAEAVWECDVILPRFLSGCGLISVIHHGNQTCWPIIFPLNQHLTP